MHTFSLKGIACSGLSLFLLLAASFASASDLTFTPTITNSEGYFEIGMGMRNDENTQGGSGSRTRTWSVNEGLNFAADGYVYHPRFLMFLTKLSGNLSQGEYANIMGGTTRVSDAGESYDIRLLFLAEHPYNFELFDYHHQVFAPGSYLRAESGTIDGRGATFHYKNDPYTFNAGYTETSVDATTSRTDTRTYRAGGTANGTLMSNRASYAHTESESSFALRTSRDEYTLGNTTRVSDIVLDSSISDNSNNQTKYEVADRDTETFFWTELLTVPLPWDFKSVFSYDYINTTNRTGPDQWSPQREDYNRSTNAAVNLSQRLYRSLITNYTRNNLSVTSSSGDVETVANTISSVYTKLIPVGQLTAGVNYFNGHTERTGTPSVINEAHNTPLFGSFTLTQQSVVESSIVVQVVDPATNALLTLPSTGYLVNRQGNFTVITIQNLSPLVPLPDPTYVYSFRVTYSLTDQSTVSNTGWGYSLKVDLLKNTLSVYYNWSTSYQDVISGRLSGGSGRSTSDTIGVSGQTGPYSGMVEYQSYDSWLNPTRTWRTMAQYRTPLDEDTTLSTRLTYVSTDHLYASGSQDGGGLREATAGVDVTADRRFPQKNLDAFLTATYSRTRSYIASDMIALNAYAMWQIGLLSLNGGAQFSRTESELTTGMRAEALSQYYYLTVTRKLF